jgi:signal peptidase I
MSLFSKKKPKKVQKTFLESTWDFIQSLGVALILALMIKASVVEAYKIPSGSMEKTLLVGDFLLANKFVYGMRLPIPFTDIRLPALAEPKPGDIIIFKFPGDTRLNYIKRCVAIEGQKVKVVNKEVYVDGKLVPLPPLGQHADVMTTYPYSPATRLAPGNPSSYMENIGQRDNMPEVTVPKGMLFMMGDNRDNSADSRFWGFLDRRLVQGKAMMIHWSWAQYDDTDPSVTFPRPPEVVLSNPWSIIESIGFNIYHLPERVRWSRIGTIIR